MRVATLLADADGIELTSADRQDAEGSVGNAVLALTVNGTTEAVTAAVDSIGADLPPDATLTLVPAGDGS